MKKESTLNYVQPECQVIAQEPEAILCLSNGISLTNPFEGNEEIDFDN